jgi:ubiquinone/menaquinone biosynthesis C-methylase UbiE
MTVDVEAYAGRFGNSPYDQLARINREYIGLLQRIAELFTIYARGCRRIADLGCGTGNLSLCISDALAEVPSLQLTAVDSSPNMISIARRKVRERQLESRITVTLADITQEQAFKPAKFDAINITHALNYTRNPQQVLKHIARWLAPGGILVATDIGRELRVANWRRQMLRWHFETSRRGNKSTFRAALRTLQWAGRCRAASRANECFQRGQRNGTYPLHSTDDFCRWIKQSGLEIISCEGNWYRDPVTSVPLDDVVVARKVE